MIPVQEDLHAENTGFQARSARKEHSKSSENLEPTQYFIKNEAFPSEVPNNRYKLLSVPQGKVSKKGEKQPTHWPISAPLTRQFHYIL